MGLDAEVRTLTKSPAILIRSDGHVVVCGGDTPGATCRDHIAASIAWAITVLSAELQSVLEAPGKGDVRCEPAWALTEEAEEAVRLSDSASGGHGE